MEPPDLSGDLFVFLRVAPDPVFTREDTNIHCAVDVPFFLAALGGEIPVPTLNGHTNCAISAGTQPGDTVRVRGGGAPALRSGHRGDQICHLNVCIPKKINKRQRELLEAFASESGYSPEQCREPGFFERLFGF